MPQGDGFWISPHGEAIRVGVNHIRAVLDKPDLYGYTKDQLQKTYKAHDEKWGTEGKAREVIITDLTKKGWIRMRHYTGRGDRITVNVNRLNDKTADKITDFFSGWKGAKNATFSPVEIHPSVGNVIRMTVAKIVKLGLYKTITEANRMRSRTIIDWLEEPLSEAEVARMRKRRIKGVSVLPAPEPINESVKQVLEEGGWKKAQVILEGSLNRIVRHFAGGDPEKTEKGSIKIDEKARFAILSSYRYPQEGSKQDEALRKELSDYTSSPGAAKVLPRHLRNLQHGTHSDRKFNEASFRKLLQDIRRAGYGAIRLSGLWATGATSIPYERSVMIVDRAQNVQLKNAISKRWVESIAKKYNQDGYIYMGPGTNGKAVLYDLDRGTGKYEDILHWNMARTMSPEQIQGKLEDKRDASKREQERKAGKEYEQWGVSVPKGSGKPSTFEDQPKLKHQRTHRTGFVFGKEGDTESEGVDEGIFAFWTELIYEGSAYNEGRIIATLGIDPFYEGQLPGSLIRH